MYFLTRTSLTNFNIKTIEKSVLFKQDASFVLQFNYAVSNLLAYSALASAYQGGSGGHGLSLEAVSPG